ncbi:hypothetical protein ON010_g17669 [Phytophthora cinnamomi]|nr:hypothetical protein ON010_g17669 [Phytophthora cinnamomi]
MWHYDVLQGLKESERRVKRRALTQIILGVLDSNDELFYFQGYHDIVSVFLLTLGNSKGALQAVRNVSETYQREPMRSGFEQVMATTRLLFPLLDAADELLCQHLQETGVLLEARNKILRCERDFGTMHGMLSSLPVAMDVEKVIARAVVLFHQLPPPQLLQRAQFESAALYAFLMVATTPDSLLILLSNFFIQQDQHVSAVPFRVPAVAQYDHANVKRGSSVTSSSTKVGRALDGDKSNYMLGSWQASIIVTAVAVGIVAIASAYTFRDRIGMRVIHVEFIRVVAERKQNRKNGDTRHCARIKSGPPLSSWNFETDHAELGLATLLRTRRNFALVGHTRILALASRVEVVSASYDYWLQRYFQH